MSKTCNFQCFSLDQKNLHRSILDTEFSKSAKFHKIYCKAEVPWHTFLCKIKFRTSKRSSHAWSELSSVTLKLNDKHCATKSFSLRFFCKIRFFLIGLVL